jgi:predicted ABC-type ATPase
VAEDVVRRRFNKGLRNFWKLYAPLADAWSVYDNSSSPDPVLMASGGKDRMVEVVEADYWEEFLRTRS